MSSMLSRCSISNHLLTLNRRITNKTQARIAEEAGACAVMALERVPADIRAQGGVARMSDPKMIKDIMETVTIPVMAKARIGHFVECQVNPPSSSLSSSTQTRTPSLKFLSCRYLKPSASTTSTNPKSSPPPTPSTTLRNTPSPLPSSVAAATWVRPSAASPKAPP
jgi:hypothetical protein